MKTNNVIVTKSKGFAIRVVMLTRHLQMGKHEYVMSRQLLRSGTSVGANVKEAIRGQSRADFAAKMNIALKEISETEYWLEILHETGYLTKAEFDSMYEDCAEIIRILMSIVKSSKEPQL